MYDERYDDQKGTMEAGDLEPNPVEQGGYSLRPDMVEFWQGRRHRLHDRFRYLQDATPGSSWKVERLAP